jgi:CRISPR-associated endonuclease/helicase Cas3
LVIVNKKKSARSLYQKIVEKNLKEVYHLSTNMCPAHRLNVLDVVRSRLHKNEPVICVSTQLIEAGIDIDFGTVIRYLAGLDSITQAAGRCNRNGKRPQHGRVYILNPKDENIEQLKDIKIGAQDAERVLREYKDNPKHFDDDRLGYKALEQFYKYYFYNRKEEMSYQLDSRSVVGREDDLFTLLSTNSKSVQGHQRITNSPPTTPLTQSFQTASKAFRAIDSPTRGVVVPYGKEGEQIINELCEAF